jgi:hypothetical protein
MGNHRPMERHLFLSNGAVKTTGGSLKLAKGQLAFVDTSATTPDGAKVVSSFVGKPKKDKVFELRLGVSDDRIANRSRSNKAMSTVPFSLAEVKDLRVETPGVLEQKVDEVIIGWDGITPGSEFNFQTGDYPFQIALEVSGDPVGYMGGGTNTEISVVRVEIPDCDPLNTCETCDGCAPVDCKAVTMEAIERLRRKQVAGGLELQELVEITPVFDCDNDVTATEIDYVWYTLSVCDTGTDNALSLVSAQYNVPVERIGRVGSTSTYQMMLPDTAGAPADYSQGIASFVKGCQNCPATYTATPNGFLYAVSFEDDGQDLSNFIQMLPNYVSGTAIKSGNDYGIGYYTGLTSQKLTDAEISAYITARGQAGKTMTVALAGSVESLCTKAGTTTTAWIEGDTCSAVEETYSIILPDADCGVDRLTELQTAYPNHTITLKPSGISNRALTLTGTSGTANINVDGDNYLATFATNLTTTATNFVATNGALLLAAGITVTAAAGVLTFKATDEIVADITITNATTDLAGTLAAAVTIPLEAACQGAYQTKVISNIVCDECDPIFKDFYITEAPESFDGRSWTKEANATTSPSGNCKCGIRFKGKTFKISPEEALRGNINFLETSAEIRVSAGYPEEIREGIGRIPEGAIVGQYLSHKVDRTMLGGLLRNKEAESVAYFLGENPNSTYIKKLLNGGLSVIDNDFTQYVHYTLTIATTKNAGGFGNVSSSDLSYSIWVEVGKQAAVEAVLNNLAAHAGIDPVKAY